MAKGNQEKALKTPQSTRKKIPNMSKNELAAELEEHQSKLSEMPLSYIRTTGTEKRS